MIQDSKEKTVARDGIQDRQAEPEILEEIAIEELSIDGICGVY
jgi:mycofactocin precursor